MPVIVALITVDSLHAMFVYRIIVSGWKSYYR